MPRKKGTYRQKISQHDQTSFNARHFFEDVRSIHPAKILLNPAANQLCAKNFDGQRAGCYTIRAVSEDIPRNSTAAARFSSCA
jgi:hypothetical protein